MCEGWGRWKIAARGWTGGSCRMVAVPRPPQDLGNKVGVCLSRRCHGQPWEADAPGGNEAFSRFPEDPRRPGALGAVTPLRRLLCSGWFVCLHKWPFPCHPSASPLMGALPPSVRQLQQVAMPRGPGAQGAACPIPAPFPPSPGAVGGGRLAVRRAQWKVQF